MNVDELLREEREKQRTVVGCQIMVIVATILAVSLLCINWRRLLDPPPAIQQDRGK